MTETRKATLTARMKSAAMDVLACAARIEAGGGSDDVQIMYEAASDMHDYALELSLAGTVEVAA